MGKSTFLQTQKTNEVGVMAVTQAFPVHYEAWTGGHLTADRVGALLRQECCPLYHIMVCHLWRAVAVVVWGGGGGVLCELGPQPSCC